MAALKSPELRELYGARENDSDGFTYRYGKYRGGYTKKPRHNNGIDRNVRADKRSVRQREMRRVDKEYKDEYQ